MTYYFLGIGGIGMSALARFFKRNGHSVSGYDRTESPLTRQLVSEGIDIHYSDDPSLISQQVDLVIYTPAIPQDINEWQHIVASGIPMKKRAQVLGEISLTKKCIAVAGSHGKTTTSAMIAHLLNKTDIGCTAFLGGIAKNIDSNLIINDKSDYIVVEADEYDRSFLHLHPTYSVITATDPDHLDIYGTHENLIAAFQQFANQTRPDGALFLKDTVSAHGHCHDDNDNEHCHCHDFEEHHNDNEHCHCNDDNNEHCHCNDESDNDEHCHCNDHHHDKHLKISEEIKTYTYSARSIEPDFYAINVRNYKGNIFFDLRTPGKVLYDIELPDSCLYNVENAVAAAAVALQCGLDEYQLRNGFKTFKGIRRRFDVRLKNNDLVFIDDYAHHPQEIASTIESVRYLYPGKRVVGIFQPHLYSRTKDLADDFAKTLSTLDEAILLPIYPAREKPIPGVSSGLILRKMDTMNKYLCTPDQVPSLVEALCPDVVLTMGAGDIDRLVPVLEQHLSTL